MPDVELVVQRTRMGRFNFTVESEAGSLTGTVVVSEKGRTSDEMSREARDKIRQLARALLDVQARPQPSRPTSHLFEFIQRDIKTW